MPLKMNILIPKNGAIKGFHSSEKEHFLNNPLKKSPPEIIIFNTLSH
jgi:hypothetical protein